MRPRHRAAENARIGTAFAGRTYASMRPRYRAAENVIRGVDVVGGFGFNEAAA